MSTEPSSTGPAVTEGFFLGCEFPATLSWQPVPADEMTAPLKQQSSSEAIAEMPSASTYQTPAPLPSLLIEAESEFYNQYRWCLNPFPRVSELAEHVVMELNKLERMQEVWQHSE